MEKNPGMFSSKTLIEERKTWTSWMTRGWVNYPQKFFLKVNYSFKLSLLITFTVLQTDITISNGNQRILENCLLMIMVP